jgi:hypothetical protein
MVIENSDNVRVDKDTFDTIVLASNTGEVLVSKKV